MSLEEAIRELTRAVQANTEAILSGAGQLPLPINRPDAIPEDSTGAEVVIMKDKGAIPPSQREAKKPEPIGMDVLRKLLVGWKTEIPEEASERHKLIKDLLKKYGATKLNELKSEDLEAFKADFDQIKG